MWVWLRLNCMYSGWQEPLGSLLWLYYFLKVNREAGEAVLRWRRNRTGRPLSPPQIHWKNIWMLSKFHETTSECWQRTSGTQKGSPLSSKRGRTEYKIKSETKEVGTVILPGKGVLKDKFPNTRKHSHRQVCGEYWNLRGQHNQEEK